MDRSFTDSVARANALPPRLVERLAAAVAERCALIANREDCMLPEGAGPVGAHIGSAILAAFADDAAPVTPAGGMTATP